MIEMGDKFMDKPAQPLSESQLWGDSAEAEMCFDLLKCTPEEKALHDVWLDRLRDEVGADEGVRFASINLREAREAVQLARYNFYALIRRNAEAVEECRS